MLADWERKKKVLVVALYVCVALGCLMACGTCGCRKINTHRTDPNQTKPKRAHTQHVAGRVPLLGAYQCVHWNAAPFRLLPWLVTNFGICTFGPFTEMRQTANDCAAILWSVVARKFRKIAALERCEGYSLRCIPCVYSACVCVYACVCWGVCLCGLSCLLNGITSNFDACFEKQTQLCQAANWTGSRWLTSFQLLYDYLALRLMTGLLTQLIYPIESGQCNHLKFNWAKTFERKKNSTQGVLRDVYNAITLLYSCSQRRSSLPLTLSYTPSRSPLLSLSLPLCYH